MKCPICEKKQFRKEFEELLNHIRHRHTESDLTMLKYNGEMDEELHKKIQQWYRQEAIKLFMERL